MIILDAAHGTFERRIRFVGHRRVLIMVGSACRMSARSPPLRRRSIPGREGDLTGLTGPAGRTRTSEWRIFRRRLRARPGSHETAARSGSTSSRGSTRKDRSAPRSACRSRGNASPFHRDRSTRYERETAVAVAAPVVAAHVIPNLATERIPGRPLVHPVLERCVSEAQVQEPSVRWRHHRN